MGAYEDHFGVALCQPRLADRRQRPFERVATLLAFPWDIERPSSESQGIAPFVSMSLSRPAATSFLQLRLDTVECIFADSTDVTDGAQESAHGDPVGPHSPDGTGASEGAESDGSGGGGWAQIFLQQAIGNIRVVVNNLVVKYVGPQAQASFTCRHICVFSAEDNWQSRLVVPRPVLVALPALHSASIF